MSDRGRRLVQLDRGQPERRRGRRRGKRDLGQRRTTAFRSTATDDNVVAGDKIGTDATGAVALGNSNDGVEIDSSSGNTIGGTVAGAADVISGNGGSGVELDGSSDNLVEGDFIGTDATGTISLGNAQEGVDIAQELGIFYGFFRNSSATDNTIGGTVGDRGQPDHRQRRAGRRGG